MVYSLLAVLPIKSTLWPCEPNDAHVENKPVKYREAGCMHAEMTYGEFRRLYNDAYCFGYNSILFRASRVFIHLHLAAGVCPRGIKAAREIYRKWAIIMPYLHINVPCQGRSLVLPRFTFYHFTLKGDKLKLVLLQSI